MLKMESIRVASVQPETSTLCTKRTPRRKKTTTTRTSYYRFRATSATFRPARRQCPVRARGRKIGTPRVFHFIKISHLLAPSFGTLHTFSQDLSSECPLVDLGVRHQPNPSSDQSSDGLGTPSRHFRPPKATENTRHNNSRVLKRSALENRPTRRLRACERHEYC